MGSRRKPRKSKSQATSSSNQTRNLLIGGGVLLGIIALGFLLFTELQGPTPPEQIAGVVEHEHQDRGHVDEHIEAGDLPPVGGIHSPEWQSCGIYDEPVSIENAVHSLEHGAMWLTYQPELAQEEIETLRDAVRGEGFALMSPYPGLRSPVVLTAWETQLELDSVTDERIAEFIERYQQGPTTPEPGAPCSGGIGSPIQ